MSKYLIVGYLGLGYVIVIVVKVLGQYMII